MRWYKVAARKPLYEVRNEEDGISAAIYEAEYLGKPQGFNVAFRDDDAGEVISFKNFVGEGAFEKAKVAAEKFIKGQDQDEAGSIDVPVNS